MRSVRAAMALSLAVLAGPALAQQRADAVLIVNSASPRFADAQVFVRPYLDHFGVPYAVLDVATTRVGADVGKYALIVIGHASLDTTGRYLDAAAQANLVNAVSQGSGLVNFDPDLTADGSTARYRFVQDVFGFGYRPMSTGEGVVFTPEAPAHWISARHAAGQQLATRQLPAALLTPPPGATVLARFGTTPAAGDPFLVVTSHGQGRAVQWASYEWMLRANDPLRGTLRGLDDLVWRGLAWAARKPFVMQGMPSFLTVRVDDVIGGLWWVRIANELRLKPFLALFYKSMTDANARDAATLVNAGSATASVHSGGADVFYYDHVGHKDLPDATVSAAFQDATAWHARYGIPISTFVVPHFYEMGTNVFAGLAGWGVRSIATHMTPGQPYGSPWLQLAPFRLHEAGASDDRTPVTYADYVSIPGHPEYANRFFDCVSEIRDDAGYEWYPDATDVPGTIGRGTRQARRALDAMALATLFTHEPFIQAFTPADWRAALNGIAANLAPYDPIPVTMDYACEYLRAKHDTRITSSVYDPATRTLTTELGGRAELATQFLVFTEPGGHLRQASAAAPVFSGTARVTQQISDVAPALVSIAVSPAAVTLVAGTTQRFDAMGTYSDGSTGSITGQVAWASSRAAVTTVDAGGLASAVGEGTATVTASLGGVTGSAAISVQAAPLVVTTTSLSGGIEAVPYAAALAARGGTAPYAWAIVAGALPPGLALTAGGAVSGTPAGAGTFGFDVRVTDAAGRTASTSVTLSVLPRSAVAGSLWPDTAAPGTPDRGADAPIELGVKFRSDVDGRITGIRFYKAAANVGPHVGSLWTSEGALLASATFTGETASGWQQVRFGTPVSITANTTYVASYHAAAGHYAADREYFASPYDRAPLHAPATGASGGNGVFGYGPATTFPAESVQGANYWVDVLFDLGAAPIRRLTSIAVAPSRATITVGAAQPFTATGAYSDGTTQDLTGQVTWASSSVAVASVSAAGVATGASVGTTAISAARDGVTGTAALTVTTASPALVSVAVSPATVRAGASATGTVTLGSIAPPGGVRVVLWSDNASAATVPSSVTVPAGAATATFPVSTASVHADTSLSVTAQLGATTRSAAVTVLSVKLVSVAVSPVTVRNGGGATGTVALDGAAPAGGVTVVLWTDSSVATVPAIVTVPAGASAATFPVRTGAAWADLRVTVTALLGATTRTASLAVTSTKLVSVAVTPTKVRGGASVTGTVTLDGAAPPGGVTVTLWADRSAVTVPSSVTVAAGATAATFTIRTSSVQANATVTFSALLGGVTRTATLALTR